MATDTRYDYQMTLADLCQAIEDGRLRATISDGQYEVKASDVRRLRRARLALPHIAAVPLDLLGAQPAERLDFSA
ncbi:MAG: hypothetical protein ACHQ4H_09920 [Ktedonobacterales bacterium]